jgi:hypothetical protein
MEQVSEVDPELGPVRWCSGCGEWWPDDDDFWDGRPAKVCRACEYERRSHRQRQLREAARRYRRRLAAS